MRPPAPTEFATYFHRYTQLVPPGDILAILREQGERVHALFTKLPAATAAHRYAEGKWTVAELVGHLADAERILVYRALCFARGEQQPLPGFDEDSYVANANFARRPFAQIVDELRTVRAATMTFFAGLDDAVETRGGLASGNPMTVRALAWTVAGHELHHLKVLRERYGVG